MKKLLLEDIYTQENGEYLKKNPTWHLEDSPWKARQILKMLKRNKMHPRTIAEVGCGVGEILNQLYASLPATVNFAGYDISPDCINLAKKREKNRLQFKFENFQEGNENYDLMLMIDVFEHVSDYLGFLKMCRTRAGHAIFHIPLDVSAQSVIRSKLIKKRRSVGHLHYFTKETATATLTDAGYEVIDYFYTRNDLIDGKPLAARMAYLPRKLLYKFNKDLAVKLLGGYSLLVLTK